MEMVFAIRIINAIVTTTLHLAIGQVSSVINALQTTMERNVTSFVMLLLIVLEGELVIMKHNANVMTTTTMVTL